MGARDLNGLYLKDYPYGGIWGTGTWTGFVHVAGKDRMIVALEVTRNEFEQWQPSEDSSAAKTLFAKLLDLVNHDHDQFDVVTAADGQAFLLFMPPG